MKKLTLKPEDLTVRSFNTEEISGAVHAMAATFGAYTCRCTAEAGCYHTMYCTGPRCVITAYDGCMTNEQGAC